MMDFSRYVNAVRFRFVDPIMAMPLPPRFYDSRLNWLMKDGQASVWEKIGTWFEEVNTILPEDDRIMKQRLHDVCNIPRMSTLAVGAIINRAVAGLADDESFVNVGIWNGFSLLAGMADNCDKACVGIDNFSEFGGPKEFFLPRFNCRRSERHFFFEMDYREYFQRIHQGPIGLYMYDGAHDYENQLMGLQVAEPFFADQCIVIVDDTNWDEPKLATRDFMARSRHRYRLLFDVVTPHNCHPTFWNGLLIIQRVG